MVLLAALLSAASIWVERPYVETKEWLGGLLILEIRNFNHAIHRISNHPGVKMEPWEIRPAAELEPMIRESKSRRAASKRAGRP